MISFFRNIRQNLLSEGKTVKYLKYAMGEIVLVVIGILIALQINNWNEERKVRDFEFVLLKELRTELTFNKNDLDQTLIILNNSIKSNKIIASVFEAHQPYQDTLDLHFARLYSFSFFIANNTTYDKLKNTGIDIIQNEEIRNRISSLYTYEFSGLEKIESLYMQEHYVNYLKPIFMNEFITFDFPNSFKVRDYESFMRNAKIKQVINFTIVNLGIVMRTQQNLRNEMEEIIGMIDEELKKE